MTAALDNVEAYASCWSGSWDWQGEPKRLEMTGKEGVEIRVYFLPEDVLRLRRIT